MDIRICAGISALETALLVPRQSTFTGSAAIKTWLTLTVVQYAVLKIYRMLIYPFVFSPLRGLPGPTNDTFLLGQTLNLFRDSNPNSIYISWMNRWRDAPFIRYRVVGNMELLLVNSLAAHKEVLQTKGYSFARPAFFGTLVGEMLGEGLLMAGAESHRRQRKILAKPFSPPNLRKLLPVFHRRAEGLLRRLDEAVRGKSNGIIEIEAAFTQTTLDIIGEAVLGVDIDQLSAPGTGLSFSECYEAMLNQPPLGGLLTFINPWVPIRWLPVEANLSFVRANTAVRRMIRDIVRQRTAELSSEITVSERASMVQKKDMVTFMVESSMEDQESLTEQELVDNVLQFMAAGHETTAGALTWAALELARSPSVQHCLREEILPLTKDGHEPDFHEIEGLHYLNNFVREVLRTHPPSLNQPREALSDLTIDGIFIPKGTIVLVVPAALHHNPNVWGSNAEDFDPNRWDSLSETPANSPYALATFSNGQRICIGKHLALLEMKTVLVAVIGGGFGFEPTEEGEGASVRGEVGYVNPSLTLKPKGGMWVKVVRMSD